ncbi:MAG: helix-turn-helix domain-containing protein [Deltaproteobacteria bacterium]|nr:helix-turn-helix domain-containing protein [Deltaproteobacteria bacterium]
MTPKAVKAAYSPQTPCSRDGLSAPVVLCSPVRFFHPLYLAGLSRCIFQCSSTPGFAEYEREVIGERTRAGMARARASGKKIGGRKKGHRTRLTTVRIQSIQVLLESGTSKAEIARQLGISERSVYRAAKLLDDEGA